MEPGDLVVELGARLPLLLLVAVVSLVGAIVAGVQLVRGRPNPLLAASPVAVPLVVAAVAAFLALRDPDPVRGVAVAAGMRLLAVFFTLPAAVIVAGCAAFAGSRGPDRRFEFAGIALAFAVLAGGVAVAGGVAEEDWLYPSIRAATYAVLGVLLAASMLGTEEGRPARPEAMATSGAVYVLVVWAGEASARALEIVFLLAVLPGVIPEGRTAYVDQAWHDVIAPSEPWHLVAMLLGTFAGLAAIGLAARVSKAAPLALVWVGLALFERRFAEPGLDALHLVAASPAPAPDTP